MSEKLKWTKSLGATEERRTVSRGLDIDVATARLAHAAQSGRRQLSVVGHASRLLERPQRCRHPRLGPRRSFSQVPVLLQVRLQTANK